MIPARLDGPAWQGDKPGMTLDDFDFHLPENLIATRPARPRSSARLLLAEGDQTRDLPFRGGIAEHAQIAQRFAQLADELRRQSLGVIDDVLAGLGQRDGSGLLRVRDTICLMNWSPSINSCESRIDS